MVVEPGRFRMIEGDYDLYLHLLQQGRADAGPPGRAEPTSSVVPAVSNPAVSRSSSPTRPKWKFPFRKVEELEEEIFQREQQMEQLHDQLTQPDVLRDGDRVRKVQQDIERHRQALATLYEHWEESAERNQ
jgi:hypothetical protein